MGAKWVDFGKNMVANIWNGVKSMWGQFTGWLSNAMKNIPVVGRFFEDEEATATLNQELGTQTIGNAIADQKGLAATPSQFVTPPTVPQDNQPIVANLLLDGRQVAQAVGDKNKLEQARE
jgi:hypothetical protein